MRLCPCAIRAMTALGPASLSGGAPESGAWPLPPPPSAAVQNFLFTLIERRYFSSAGGAPGAATDALAGLLHQERLPSVMWHTIAEGSEGSAALDDSLTPFGNLTPVRSNEALTRYGQGAVGGHNDTGRIDDLL